MTASRCTTCTCPLPSPAEVPGAARLTDELGIPITAARVAELVQHFVFRSDTAARDVGLILNGLLAELDRLTARAEQAERERVAAQEREAKAYRRRAGTIERLRTARLERDEARAATLAFVTHHDNGQAGQPGHPKAYGEQAAWLAEWDRRIDALRLLAASDRADQEGS